MNHPSERPFNDRSTPVKSLVYSTLVYEPGQLDIDPDALYTIFADCEIYEGKFDTSPRHTWFGQFVNGMLVGICGIEERDRGVWYLHGAVVLPNFRRQGIFARLHDMRCKYAIERGARVLLAVSSPMNRALYDAEGWTPMTHYPYHEQFDEVVYFRCVGNGS